MGGPKGQSQQNSQTGQTQTYTADPRTQQAITGALGQAQSAASQPFNLPVAPVAGFSQDQQNAFNTINNSQGIGNPYINAASNYFSPQGAQAFYNPAVGAVTDQLKNIFGAQNTQNTANLTQAAGGVGADRIAVGQADLANQQGLAAGQTYANLWNSAVGQAQSAGQGQLATGNQAFNQAFGGAQQQLASGGLQQQLQQAQMNAPYQWQVAQQAYPFQTSNFLTNAVASLAPGYGGTTAGTGYNATTNTPAQPSIWSQILGGAGVGVGLYNGLNGGSGTTGTAVDPGSIYNTGNGQISTGTQTGPTPFYAHGGSVDNPYHFDDGGAANPYGAVSDAPINISGQSVVPTSPQMAKIAPHVPQIDLSPPKQQQSQSSSSSSGPGLGDIAKIAMMFAADGGAVSPDNMRRFDGYDPKAFFGGEEPGGTVALDLDNPYRLAGPEAMNKWRRGVDADTDAGQVAAQTGDVVPPPDIITRGMSQPSKALAFAEPDHVPPGIPLPRRRPPGADAPPDAAAPEASPYPDAAPRNANAASPYGGGSAHPRQSSVIDNPWMALAAAGLGIMGGSSPFAGVNIGQGGMQGLKMLQEQRENARKDETTDQAWRRLDQEQKFHEDQYNRLTAKEKLDQDKPISGGTSFDPVSGQMKHIMYQRDKNGEWKPLATEPAVDANGEPVKGQAAIIGDEIIAGRQPPVLTGLTKIAPQIKQYFGAQKFDQAKAMLEYKAAEKQIQALNGPQMQRGYQLSKSVDSTIDEVKDLSSQMKLGGVPFLNKLELQGYVNGIKGTKEQQELAVRYTTAVNTLKEEFANLANGGYAPTEPAWALANEQVNGNYGMSKLDASLTEIKRLINYRMGFMSQGFGPGAANRYQPQQPGGASPVATGTPAAAPSGNTGTTTPGAFNVPGMPGSTPQGGGGKATSIWQNGVEYKLQPDGSYK